MEAVGMQKKKKQALVFSNFTFPYFFTGVLVKYLLQIPEMDKQRNPGPKKPTRGFRWRGTVCHIANVITLCRHLRVRYTRRVPAYCNGQSFDCCGFLFSFVIWFCNKQGWYRKFTRTSQQKGIYFFKFLLTTLRHFATFVCRSDVCIVNLSWDVRRHIYTMHILERIHFWEQV